MITRTKDTSFLANSSKKFFHLGLALSLLLVIGAFKLPLYSKAPKIDNPTPPGFEDVMIVTHFMPVSKELPPEEPKPKTKTPKIIVAEKIPVPDDTPIKETITEPTKTAVSASTKQIIKVPIPKAPTPTVTIAEVMPSFNGGEQELFAYVANNVFYSPIAIDLGLEGKVYVRFVVNKDGKIKNVEIAKGIDPLLDNAAIKVVKNMPTWNAGSQNGENVNVSMVLPINFVLK